MLMTFLYVFGQDNAINRASDSTLSYRHGLMKMNSSFLKRKVGMHFSHLQSVHDDPDLKLNGEPIPVVAETKFLGLVLDKKLTFVPHIKYVKDRCLKALNLLRVVAHMDWGADCATLLKFYRSQLRSKLDYGCVVYGSARRTALECLDRVQNAALRICLGAFQTSPIPIAYM